MAVSDKKGDVTSKFQVEKGGRNQRIPLGDSGSGNI